MYHAKHRRSCLLCHLVVQTDDYVATGGAQKPLFRPYKDVFCQKAYCLSCVSGQGGLSNCVHRDCYQYYRHFFPESRLQLRDLLQLSPGTVDFVYQNSETEQRAYGKYIGHLKPYLDDHDLGDSSTGFLWSIVKKFPPEVLGHIAKFLWPCALQKPVTILAEKNSLLEFSERKEHKTAAIIEYRGEPVFVTKVAFLGSSYVTGLSIDRKSTVHRRGELRIAVVRDNVGITDIDFNGKFPSSRQGLWYKVIGTGADHLIFRICIMNILTDFEPGNEESPWIPYWNVPLLHPPTVHTWYINSHNASHPILMRYVELRNDIKGVIVWCTVNGIISIDTYADSSKWRSSGDESRNSRDAVCIYFPLAKNEDVVSAWVRELNNGTNMRYPTLILSTSLQRTCTFGPYVPREQQDKYQYHPLVFCDNRVTGLCYNDKGILSSEQMRIGVTQEKVSLRSPSDRPFQATRAPPISPIPQWFQSLGAMTGVDRIRLYTDNEKPHKPTVGILLIYEDHEELLGQFGYDHDVENYELTGPLYFFSGQTQIGPYTKVVYNRETGEGWVMIPRNAELVWWFTPGCSVLEIIQE